MARGTGVDIRRFAEAPLPPLPAEGCAPEEAIQTYVSTLENL